MLFWIVWAIAFVGVASFFVASVLAYLRSPSAQSASTAEASALPNDGQMVALEAQFFLAPKLAMDEFREMLRSRKAPDNLVDEVHDRASLVQLLLQLDEGRAGRTDEK